MIRVGTAGWSYPDWAGVVSPTSPPRGFSHLGHLARFVDCIEINASFYATPRKHNVARWTATVRDLPRFRFSAKLRGLFTHEGETDPALWERAAAEWLDAFEPLRSAGRLCAVLAQFPVAFRASNASWRRLDRIRESFGHVPLVLELRHRSWFMAEALRRIEASGVSLARIDLPPSSQHPPEDAPTFGPIGYLRLHGRNGKTWFQKGVGRDARYDYLYSPEEVRDLVRVARRIASGADETFVVTNNHFSGKAVVNALEILAALREEKPAAPPELVKAYPRLAPRVRMQGQRDLFGGY